MKKQGFSYLELIISMGLVVMVVFLTTPFLIHLEKSALAKSGEYRAYVKYTCKDPTITAAECDCETNPDDTKCDWILFENVRRNRPDYAEDDKRCACDGGEFNPDGTCKGKQICQFLIPSKTTNYKVHVFGGGGGGSMGLFNSGIIPRPAGAEAAEEETETATEEENSAEIYKGEGGKAGVSLHPESESLAKAVSNEDNTIVQIFRCQDVAISPKTDTSFEKFEYPKRTVTLSNGREVRVKNCIGTGGNRGTQNTNAAANDLYSIYQRFLIRRMFTEEKSRNTKDTYCKLAPNFFQDGSNSSLSNLLCDYVDKYKSGKKQEANQIYDTIVNDNNVWRAPSNGNWVDLISYADWGGDSFFWFDDSNEPVPVRGGEGGKTVKSKAISFVPEDFMTLADFINPNKTIDKTVGYYTENLYVSPGTEGETSNYSAGYWASGGNCLSLKNDGYDEKYCHGSSAPVNSCSKNAKVTATCSNHSDNDGRKSYSFGAGGGGGAVLINKEDISLNKDPGFGGMGAGGAVVIQWE